MQEPMKPHHRHRRARGRHLVGPREWRIHARVERFVEPALLLLLREGPTHGYDLLEQLPALTGERVDMGNLYRYLRALEDEEIVRSEWADGRRTYELTDAGRALLDQWATALRASQHVVDAFLERHERGKEVNDAPRA
jgi:PadR family transcriptional regulator PadR